MLKTDWLVYFEVALGAVMGTRFYLYVKAFSDLGSMMDSIVLTAVIYASTHSSLWVSAVLAVRTLSGLLSSLSSGSLADRVDRRKIMVVSDVLRALSILALIVVPTPQMILVVSFLIGFLSSYFGVGFSASIPEMFGEQDIVATNSLISRLSSISMVGGFFLAGILSTYLGYRLVLTLDLLSYLCSALVLWRIRWAQAALRTLRTSASSRTRRSRSAVSPSVKPKQSILSDLKAVKAYLWTQPILLIIFAGYLVETFSAASHNVGIPLLAGEIAPSNQSFVYGLIWGIWGFGNVLATVLLPKFSFVRNKLHLSYWLSTICMSIGFITFLSNLSLFVVLPFAFLTGIFDAGSGTLCNIILQKTDNDIRGRIFGVSNFINRLGFFIGFLVVPVLLGHMSLPHMVWCLHGLNIVAVVAAIVTAKVWAKGKMLRKVGSSLPL